LRMHFSEQQVWYTDMFVKMVQPIVQHLILSFTLNYKAFYGDCIYGTTHTIVKVVEGLHLVSPL
jgi:hypothetical protein